MGSPWTSSAPDVGLPGMFRAGQPPGPGVPQVNPYQQYWQRFTTFTLLVGAAGAAGIRATQAHQAIDGIMIQSIGSNVNLIQIFSANSGIQLTPGQTFIVEIDNSKSLMTAFLEFFGFANRRVSLDGYDFIMYGSGGDSAVVSLATKTEEDL
jgi:hypothetical protein